MSKRNIRLVASDLDGTILRNGAQSCDPEIFPLIKELLDLGIYFVPASGRQYASQQRLFKPIKEELTYLSDNGSLVTHLDQILYKKSFEDDLAMELCQAIVEHPDCEVLISGERTCYVIPKKSEFARHLVEDVGNHITIIKSPLQIEEPILKISFYTESQNQKRVETEFAPRFANRAVMMTSGTEWIDFAPLGTNKGSALKAIGELLGIAPEEMMAFGDNENDKAMLEMVGYPYIMDPCNPRIEHLKGKRCTKVEPVLRELIQEIKADRNDK
ncbi:MAG: HAD-IIB family hydrolase [Lachnospiraceae bacterium]